MKPDLSPSGRERIEQLEAKVAELEAAESALQMRIRVEQSLRIKLESKHKVLESRVDMLERRL